MGDMIPCIHTVLGASLSMSGQGHGAPGDRRFYAPTPELLTSFNAHRMFYPGQTTTEPAILKDPTLNPWITTICQAQRP
jgi:hypothetical protein